MGALDKHIYYDRINQEVNIGDVVSVPEANSTKIGYVVRTTEHTLWYKAPDAKHSGWMKQASRYLVIKGDIIDKIKQHKGWE